MLMKKINQRNIAGFKWFDLYFSSAVAVKVTRRIER